VGQLWLKQGCVSGHGHVKKIKKIKFEKDQFKNNGAIQLYIAREGKLSDPDPAKRSGSDRIRIRNPGVKGTVA